VWTTSARHDAGMSTAGISGGIGSADEWAAVRARRLARHGLSTPLGSVAEVARATCGVHAQVMSAAEISVALRLADATCADVRAALRDERTLVKTYGPRGTVHLLATADLGRWCGALSSVPASSGLTSSVLSPQQTEDVVGAIAVTLAASESPLTIDELGAGVVARTGPWAADPVIPAFQGAWPRWRRAIDLAAHRGALLFGVPRGRTVTFAAPTSWRPDFAVGEATAARSWLLRSYLRGYGPARPSAYARWLATSTAWAKQQFEEFASELIEVELLGEPAWLAADDAHPMRADPAGLRLLPYFDSYVVGAHPRERLFPGRAAERALRQGQAGNYPVLLRDGEVAGVWHRRARGRRATVTVEPLAPLGAGEQRALRAEVDRLGRITAADTDLVVGPVTVGPHA
jgi:hypothetical protein